MQSADYVAETTTSIAGTSGDGAVTLTAITNRPRLSTVFGTTKRWVRYVIEDTVNHKFEQGIGSVTSNVLTRTRPQVTWDGTTWSDKAPAALQFGSSPTSGNIVIRLAATAEGTPAVIDARQASVAGDSNWRDYRFSAHCDGAMPAYSSMALTADREYYFAHRLDTPGLLSGLQLEVTTLVASSNLKWALYDVGSDGLPGSKIVDGNIIDTSTTGFKADTTKSTWTPSNGIWLNPGWYCIGILPSAAISVRSANYKGGQTPFGLSSISYGHGDCIFASGSYATGLPADASAHAAGGTMQPKNANNVIYIGLKVVQ